MHVRVIGVGSGFGDDAVALAVIDWLAARPHLPGVSFARCRRPLPDLLDAFEGADAAVLVDATRCADPPGSVRALDEHAIAAPGATSSHGFGTRRVVSLARSLDRAPARITWVGIAIGAVRPGDEPSAPVCAAIPEAGRVVLESVRRLAGFGREGSCDA